MKKLILLLSPLLLIACNSGGSSSTQDVQTNTSSSNTANGNYSISITATGCKSITSNGSCSVNVAYTGTGTSYYNQALQLNNVTGYSNNITSTCTTHSSISPANCVFTISGNGTNTGTAQNATVSLGSTNASVGFVLGGGI